MYTVRRNNRSIIQMKVMWRTRKDSADLLHHAQLLTVQFADFRNWIRHHDLVRQLAVGALSVAAVMLVKVALKDGSADVPSYVLFTGAIAAATWFGGWPGGVVAMVTAGLFVRFLMRPAGGGSIATDSAFLLFVAEAVFFVVVVARLQGRRAEAASQLQGADAEIVRLRRREQDLLLIEQSFEALAVNVRDHACILLDIQGRVTRWNRGAARLYGYSESTAVGTPWPSLGAPEITADPELLKLPGASMTAAPAVGTGWMTTAEERPFRGEVAVSPLRDKTGVAQGFAVVVRDLTNEQASEDFRSQAITENEALQGETHALVDELEALKTVLDPELSELPLSPLLKELAGRVLTTLGVDGVAILDTRYGANGTIFAPARGLQAQLKRGARLLPRRLRVIQNDVTRAREGSVVVWPEPVGLMVTIPVSRQKRSLGALEVVARRARRWTERDAVILLLAADRAAAALAAATSQESAEPDGPIDQNRLSLPQ
jgi:PAS domain S-box-containing protein